MYELKYDPAVCDRCETVDCLMRCRYIDVSLAEAREERKKIIAGMDSRVLDECITCYACEEYCPYHNHPFFQIVEQQERLEKWPVPTPITRQQLGMMAMKKQMAPQQLRAPVINMCFFPMLSGTVRGKLFEGASAFGGSDVFCNIMWLHFAKNSVIRERLPRAIENIMNFALRDSGVKELVCFHDECYGAYTHLAPAFGIEVPFKPVHLFEYLAKRLTALKKEIRPLNKVVAYQRPCSNRLIPETQPWVDEIFGLIGATRPERRYDRENALCCAMTVKAAQRDDLADDLQKQNLDDMQAVGAEYCVFNCPACFMELSGMVKERGITPILMSDLCHQALGQGTGW
jgi:Fe-S oxidoreductase